MNTRRGSFFTSRAELLEARMMLNADMAPLQNVTNQFDVSNDGKVTSIDAMKVIYELLHGRSGPISSAAGEPGSSTVGGAVLSSFVDVNGDNVLDTTDAELVMQRLNGAGEPGDVVTFSLQTTDLDGNEISTVATGDEFVLHVFTQDTQESSDLDGVFAAYLDVEYDASLASVAGPIQYPGQYTSVPNGDISQAGLIDEAGGTAGGLTPTGKGLLEVFSIRMRADAVGELDFSSNPADEVPEQEVLVYGSGFPVSTDDILYGSTTISITGSTQTPEQDLVQFAKDLAEAEVELWSTNLFARGRVANQLELFEEGEAFLPFTEIRDEDGNLTPAASTAGITTANTWIFPDGSRSAGPLLTLAEISTRSGVPIPTGVSPAIAPLSDVTVLNGSPLHIPLDGSDPNGDPLRYEVTIANSSLVSSFLTPDSNRSLSITASDAQGNFGEMVFELFDSRVPRVTEQIGSLADTGFYDGVTFHRVVNGFVIQGGDPTATGRGGSMLPDFNDQFHPDLQHNTPGLLSMAKSLDDTNNSQFFVTEHADAFVTSLRNLDFNHSIFGILVEGDRVRESISNVDVQGTTPTLAITMDQVDVYNDGQNAVLMLTALQSTGTTAVTVTAIDTAGNSSSETFTVNLAADTVNGRPYLNDIPAQVFQPGDDIEFDVSAVDVEGDTPIFSVSTTVSGATANVSALGRVTVTPPSGFVGNLPVTVSVSQGAGQDTDDQLVNIQIVPDGPTSVDLLAATDSGISDSDNITNVTDLQFRVEGVAIGARVLILAGGVVVGEGTATDTSIVITTANPSALGDGQHGITAVQEVDGERSQESPRLEIQLDQRAPEALLNDAPETGEVGTVYTFDAQHIEETTSLIRYSLGNSPAGMTIDEFTGLVSWTPSTGQRGSQTFEIEITDVAGNTTTDSSTVSIGGGVAQVRLVATDMAGNPIGGVALGSNFLLQVFVEDLRTDGTGIANAFFDVAFDDNVVIVDGAINFGASYPDDNSGSVNGGFINELGGSTAAALGGGEVLLASIPMQAANTGLVVFIASAADDVGHELSFEDGTSIPISDVSLLNAMLSVLNVSSALNAIDDNPSVDEDTIEIPLDVLGNDELGPLSEIVNISASTDPDMNGTAFISSDRQSIIYTPAPNFFGDEVFTYTIRDSQGVTDTATVTVTVNPVNDPPVVNDDAYPQDFEAGDSRILLLVEDATTEAIRLPVIGLNDSQEPDSITDPLEIFLITNVDDTGTFGALEDRGDNGIYYTLAPDFFGTDTFTFTVTDQHDPPLSDSATVTVTVAEVNDPPSTLPDAFEVPGGSTTFNILASQVTGNDSVGPANESAQVLTITNVVADRGTAVVNAQGGITYTPGNTTGTVTLTYTVSDDGTTQGSPAPLTAEGTITLVVASDTAPEAFDDEFFMVANGSPRTFDLLANDLANGSATLTITGTANISNGGTVEIVDNGTAIRYQPASGFFGDETFTYTVSNGDQTDTGTVTITVADPATTTESSFAGKVFFDSNNDGVQGTNERGIRGVRINLTGTNADGQTVSRQTITDSRGGYVFSLLPKGTYTISQSQSSMLADGIETSDVGADGNGNDSFTITVSDDIIVSGENTFGERGLSPQLAMIDALASSRGTAGFFTTTADGQSQWIRDIAGWDEFSSINVAVSADKSEVTLTVVDSDSNTLEATVPSSDKSRVQIIGSDGDDILVRIAAAAADFVFSAVTSQAFSDSANDPGVAEPTPPTPSAADAIFAALS